MMTDNTCYQTAKACAGEAVEALYSVYWNDYVMSLFRLGHARPEEWSRLLPGALPGEVMRILTKRATPSGQD